MNSIFVVSSCQRLGLTTACYRQNRPVILQAPFTSSWSMHKALWCDHSAPMGFLCHSAPVVVGIHVRYGKITKSLALAFFRLKDSGDPLIVLGVFFQNAGLYTA